MGLIYSYCHTYFHTWKLKDRANTKVTQDHMTCKSQGWAWNLGRVYPFHHGTVLLLRGRNIQALLGTVASCYYYGFLEATVFSLLGVI